MTSIPNDAIGDALRRIIAGGSDLTKPMEIDYFVAVPSDSAGNQVARMAQEQGFNTKVSQDDKTSEWTCYCTKTFVPEYAEIVKIEQQLDTLAQPFGGYIDGFGSWGNSDEKS